MKGRRPTTRKPSSIRMHEERAGRSQLRLAFTFQSRPRERYAESAFGTPRPRAVPRRHGAGGRAHERAKHLVPRRDLRAETCARASRWLRGPLAYLLARTRGARARGSAVRVRTLRPGSFPTRAGSGRVNRRAFLERCRDRKSVV